MAFRQVKRPRPFIGQSFRRAPFSVCNSRRLPRSDQFRPQRRHFRAFHLWNSPVSARPSGTHRNSRRERPQQFGWINAERTIIGTRRRQPPAFYGPMQRGLATAHPLSGLRKRQFCHRSAPFLSRSAAPHFSRAERFAERLTLASNFSARCGAAPEASDYRAQGPVPSRSGAHGPPPGQSRGVHHAPARAPPMRFQTRAAKAANR